jgi:hypothetical protein
MEALPSLDAIAKRLKQTLEPMVAGTFGSVPGPSPEIRSHLDALVEKRQYTVRDGILTLLAMEVEHGEVIDWRKQELHNPARNASRFLGSELYPSLHITGSPEALQTGVKGVGRYIDRRNATWKAVLEWASDECFDPEDALRRNDAGADLGIEPVCGAFLYLAARIAETARNLPDMPSLDTPRLTFPAVFALLDEMLSRPSAGAHEQFIFAALLEAWRAKLGETGVVETKNLNASDASAGSAADVQERHRGQVTEAYELTASDYGTKIRKAQTTLRRHDLRRVHIVARDAAKATGEEIAAALPTDLDLTVLDVREEVRSMLARLGRPHRRYALERLYVLLVDRQPNDLLVKDYVGNLVVRGLTEAT